MAEKKHILVVCGYGCHLNVELKKYLTRVVEFLRQNKVDMAVFCGGFTQKYSAPKMAECLLMREYIHSEIGFGVLKYSLVEDESYTTFKNMEYAAHWISKNYQENVKITIFCESTRSANVLMCARHFMKNSVEEPLTDIVLETVFWEKADPFKQAFNLIYNKLAITFPWLGLAEHEQQRRIKRSKHI